MLNAKSAIYSCNNFYSFDFLYLTDLKNQFLFLLSVVFILSAILSIYHVGVEQNIFKEPFVCDIGDKSLEGTKEDLLRQLENNKISCKDVTFSIFGISLATINTIISIALSAIIVKNYINYEKN